MFLYFAHYICCTNVSLISSHWLSKHFSKLNAIACYRNNLYIYIYIYIIYIIYILSIYTYIYYIYTYNETKQRELELLISSLHIAVTLSSQSFSQFITVNLQYNGIKIAKQCSDANCVKIIRIRGWCGPHYPTFWVNARTYSVILHIQSKYGKNSHQKKAPNTDTFHTLIRFCSS